VSPVAFAEVTQVDEELHGRVVFAWLLRGDELVHLLPRGRLVDREGVEVPLPGGRRGRFPPCPVAFALLGDRSSPCSRVVRGRSRAANS
jgi:hypothetical protein